MATLNGYISPRQAHQDQKQYPYQYLRKYKVMNGCTFATRLNKLNINLLYFLPDCLVLVVTALLGEKVNEIQCHKMTNLLRNKMME